MSTGCREGGAKHLALTVSCYHPTRHRAAAFQVFDILPSTKDERLRRGVRLNDRNNNTGMHCVMRQPPRGISVSISDVKNDVNQT